MPFVELVLGVYLLTNLTPSFSRLAAAIVFLAFAAIQIIALARGLEIDCGCFGSSHDKPISVLDAALNVGTAAILLFYWWLEFRSPSQNCETATT